MIPQGIPSLRGRDLVLATRCKCLALRPVFLAQLERPPIRNGVDPAAPLHALAGV